MHDQLIVRGAREHNLKGVDLDLPRDSMIVFTGLSGSGKSSLAFDTIFAEGQRRYVESLSSYARQFLGQMDKPDVDFIEGLSPAVSIDQKSTSRNPRSTVGTITEIHDYLRLLYARAGIAHCPTCGARIQAQTPQQIVDRVRSMPEGTRFQVLAPVVRGRKGEYQDLLEELKASGYVRAIVDGQLMRLEEVPPLEKKLKHTIEVVVDRLVVREGMRQRLTDSVETSLRLSDGLVVIDCIDLEDAVSIRRNVRAPMTTHSLWMRLNHGPSHSTLPTARVRSAQGLARSLKSIPNLSFQMRSFLSHRVLSLSGIRILSTTSTF